MTNFDKETEKEELEQILKGKPPLEFKVYILCRRKVDNKIEYYTGHSYFSSKKEHAKRYTKISAAKGALTHQLKYAFQDGKFIQETKSFFILESELTEVSKLSFIREPQGLRGERRYF